MGTPYKCHVAKPSRRVRPVTGGGPQSRPGKAVTRADLEQAAKAKAAAKRDGTSTPQEIGGPAGPEPTRYGDWEINGRCIDF